MVEQEFNINVRDLEAGMIVDLSGDLTKQAEEKLLYLKEWEQGLDAGKRFLILNFTDVHYMNSHGIAILIRLVRASHKGNYQILAYGLSSHYTKLLRMVGVTNHLSLYTDEQAIHQMIKDPKS